MRIRVATPSDIPAIARIHVETWRTTYQGIVPEAYLAALSYERRLRSWQRLLQESPQELAWLDVAEDQNEGIVGFAHGGQERSGNLAYRGELKALYVLQNHHRRGIGRGLVGSLASKLQRSGMDSMLVWVLADNPACHFYAALGGVVVDRQSILMAGQSLPEVAYGWGSTAGLSVD